MTSIVANSHFMSIIVILKFTRTLGSSLESRARSDTRSLRKKALVSIINKVVMTIIAIVDMMDPLLELSKRSLGTLRYISMFAVHGRDILNQERGVGAAR
mmetsp:Transcript_11236/g.16282  ORF Transcript_11236/g.16282 Transcript_11236/m.16282 type:complete len:100 (+) Transcript_11236:1570-1869(+)